MKTVLIQLKCLTIEGRKSTQVNVEINEATDGQPASVERITFKNAVRKVHYADFVELYHQIELAVQEQTDNSSLELTVGDIKPALTKGGISQFEAGVRGMAKKLQGTFNEEEAKHVNKALDLVDFFLGRKKPTQKP